MSDFTIGSNLAATSALVIDTTAPTITSVTSTTDDGTYNETDTVNVTVTFSEAVTLDGGNLVVTLETGDTDRTVTITEITSSTTASGTYTVQSGDTSSDLTASGIALSAGTLSDAGGNAMSDFTIGSNLAATSALVIDTTAPTITSVTSTTDDGTYNETDTVNVTVTFSEAVTLDGGNLVVTLETGDTDRTVTITEITSSTTASGTYTVQSGDTSSDLTASGIALSAGTLSDAGGNAMSDFTIGSNLAATSALVIDTTAPTVTGVDSSTDAGAYKAGDEISIQVTFSETVNVTGTPQLTLETGGSDAVVNYASGSGSSVLTFTYTVGAGNTSSDLDYASTTALALNGGTIQDVGGNNATLTLATPGEAGSLADNEALVVDTTAPTITSVTSTTDDGTYGEGAQINVTVNYSEPIWLGCNLRVTLETGETNRSFIINNQSGVTSSSFTYTVQAGDSSSDLTVLLIDNCVGALRDNAGNAATNFTPITNLAANSDLVIDTTAPSVTGVDSSTDAGAYIAGDEISIQVTFSETVNVTGTPQLTLETGGSDAVVNYASGSGSSVLTFTYTVGSNQTSSDLDYASTTALALNGGTIQDVGGNNATLTLATPGEAGSLAANEALVIDTTAPVISSVTSITADGTYNANDQISILIIFTETVNVTGTPQLTLETGGTDAVVDYASGSGSSILTFVYTVSSGDNSSDLDYASTTALALNGGTIKDAAGNNATLTLATPGASNSLGSSKALVVDTTAPTINAIATSALSWGDVLNATEDNADGTVTVTTVGVEDGQTLTITLNSATYTANVSSNSATITISAAGLQALTDGQTYTLTADVSDAVGNAAAQVTSSSFTVDTTAPTITSVTSTTDDGTYNENDTVNVTVTFSEAVTLDGGNLVVTLETGDTDRTVTITEITSSTTASGTYTVQSGDTSSDLTASGIALSAGTLSDAGGNAMSDFTIGSNLAATSALVIDTTAPTVTGVDSSTDAGDLHSW